MSETLETTHLRRLVRLRHAMIGGQLIAVLGAHYGLGVSLPLPWILALIAAFALLNTATRRWLATAPVVTPQALTLQLLADIGQLTGLLYLSGGYANPFIFMLLPPLAIAAVALTAWRTLWVAVATVLCYSLLLVAHVPLPVLDRLAILTPSVLRQTGMWVCFVVSAAMIVFFVVRTRQTLRLKDRELADARERAMRNEHLAELGGLAAGTAHELGTPLATISVIAEELEASAGDPDQRRQLALLRDQVRRCRDAIDELARSAGELRASGGQAVAPAAWIEGLAARWRGLAGNTTIAVTLPEGQPRCRLLLDRALDQAVSSVIANACRASDEVEVLGRWDAGELAIEVRDRGPGVPEALVGRLGREPLGDRPGVAGLGLGLYLATGTVERFGGRLELERREVGGTRARITLPLDPLRLDDERDERAERIPVAD